MPRVRFRQVDRAFHFDQPRNRRRVAEPLRPPLDVTANHMAKVRARKALTLLVAHVRKTEFQIGMHDAAARARNAIEQRAKSVAHAGNHAIWQECEHAQQSCHQKDEYSAFHERDPG
jgi:hypothetical protein